MESREKIQKGQIEDYVPNEIGQYLAAREHSGNLTADPSAGIIEIPHGFDDDPIFVGVTLGDNTAELSTYTITADKVNITITFSSTPIATSLKVWWLAKI